MVLFFKDVAIREVSLKPVSHIISLPIRLHTGYTRRAGIRLHTGYTRRAGIRLHTGYTRRAGTSKD